MALYVNNVEVDTAYVNSTELDAVYADGNLVWEGVQYISKPTVSGSYTFNASSQSAVISGYDASTMTQSGTASATAAGTYTVTFTPRSGYAWSDTQGTESYSATWKIKQRSLTVPSLSGTTAFAWLQGATHTVSDSGFNGTYMTRGGTWSATDGSTYAAKSYTVTWSLRYPASTYWADSTTAAKKATWTVNWVNGTSHYSGDIYNRGWVSSSLKTYLSPTIVYYSSYFTYAGSVDSALYLDQTYKVGDVLHVQIKDVGGTDRSTTVVISDCNSSGTSRVTCGTGTVAQSYVEVTGTKADSSRPYFAITRVDSFNMAIKRIWVT